MFHVKHFSEKIFPGKNTDQYRTQRKTAMPHTVLCQAWRFLLCKDAPPQCSMSWRVTRFLKTQ